MKIQLSMSAPKKAATPLPPEVEKIIARLDPDYQDSWRQRAAWMIGGQQGKAPPAPFGQRSGEFRRVQDAIETYLNRKSRNEEIGQDASKEIPFADLKHVLPILKKELSSLGFEVVVSKYARRDKESNVAELSLGLTKEKMVSPKGIFKWHVFENLLRDNGWQEVKSQAFGFGLIGRSYLAKVIDGYRFILVVAGSNMTYHDTANGGMLVVQLKLPTFS